MNKLYVNQLLQIGASYGIIISVVLIIMMTPFVENINLANSFSSTKTFLVGNFLIIGFICCGILVMFGKYDALFITSKHLTQTDICFFALLVYIIVNRYFIQPIHGFSLQFIELIELSGLYLLIRLFFKGKHQILFWLIAISGFGQVFFGVLQSTGFLQSMNGAFPITGSFHNPGPYSGYLTLNVAVSLGLLFTNYKNDLIKGLSITHWHNPRILIYLKRCFLMFNIVSTFIVLIYIESRASWVACLITFVFFAASKENYLYLRIKNIFQNLNFVYKIVILIILITGAVVCSQSLYSLKKSSADGRLFVWKISGNLIKQKPLFGIGFDRFKAQYLIEQANYFAGAHSGYEERIADNVVFPFNEVLQIVVDNGLLCLTILILMILTCIFGTVGQQNKRVKKIGLGGLLSVTIFGFFSYPSYVLPIKIILIIYLGILSNLFYTGKDAVSFRFKNPFRPFLKFLIGLMLVTTCFLTFYKLRVYMEAYRYWEVGRQYSSNFLYSNSITSYKYAANVLNQEGEFLTDYGISLVQVNDLSKGICVLNSAKNHIQSTLLETTLGDAYLKEGFQDLAEEYYQNASNMVPNRYYPDFLLVKLYLESGQKQKAFLKAKEILNKEVKVKSLAIDELKAKMQRLISGEEISL